MKNVVLFVLTVLCVSCTKTSVVSVKQSPQMRPTFHSIVVSAPYDNLEMKSKIENLCMQKLSNANVKVYRAIDVLPPLKSYTQSEISETLVSRNIEALVIVAVSDFWVDYFSTPGKTVSKTQSTGVSSSTIQRWGNLFSVSTTEAGSSTTTTRHIPGMTLTQSNVKLDARVVRIELNKEPEVIWRANSTTSGDFITSTSKVLADAIREISEKLILDGIIAEGFQELPDEVRLIGGEHGDIDLGCVSCPEFDIDAIFNSYGTFGRRAEKSIWNPESMFGDVNSESCPCNPTGTKPPRIVNQYGEQIGFLSINPDFPVGYKSRKTLKWLNTELCQLGNERDTVR